MHRLDLLHTDGASLASSWPLFPEMHLYHHLKSTNGAERGKSHAFLTSSEWPASYPSISGKEPLMPIANLNVANRKLCFFWELNFSHPDMLYWTEYLCMFIYVLILLCYINCWHYSQMSCHRILWNIWEEMATAYNRDPLPITGPSSFLSGQRKIIKKSL